MLGTLMIPDQLRLVPVYLMMIDFPLTGWNLTQTLHGYVFFGSSIALATSLFLMRQYFLTIPKDYEEAAKLDGAGYFKTYWRIMLPLAAPAVAGGRDPHLPGHLERVLLGQPAADGATAPNYTVQMGLAQFRFQYQTLWPQLMAAATDRDPPRARGVRLLPALLRRGRRGGGGEGMIAAVDRLPAARRGRGAAGRCPRLLRGVLAARGAQLGLSAYVLGVLAVARSFPLALVLLLGVGPLAAALVSAAVIVVETGSLTFIETTAGAAPAAWRAGSCSGDARRSRHPRDRRRLSLLRRRGSRSPGRWRSSSSTWPRSSSLYQLLLWPLAVREPERPLGEVAAEAGIALVRRPVDDARARAGAARGEPRSGSCSPFSRF